ncbi:hypothetical protein B7463_g5705, partial [Scytalidium lignicola]
MAANINKDQKKKTENRLKEHEIKKQQTEEYLEQEDKLLAVYEEKYQKTLKIYERLTQGEPTSISLENAIFTAAKAVNLSPELFILGLAMGGVKYKKYQQFDVLN